MKIVYLGQMQLSVKIVNRMNYLRTSLLIYKVDTNRNPATSIGLVWSKIFPCHGKGHEFKSRMFDSIFKTSKINIIMTETFNQVDTSGQDNGKGPIKYDWAGRERTSYESEEKAGKVEYIGQGAVASNNLDISKRDPLLVHFWRFA